MFKRFHTALTVISLSADLVGIWGIVGIYLLDLGAVEAYLWLFWIAFLAGGLGTISVIYPFVKAVEKFTASADTFLTRHQSDSPERYRELIQKASFKLINSVVIVEYLQPGDGRQVKVTKQQQIEVLHDEMTEIWDRQITVDPEELTASIDMASFTTSVGRIKTVKKEGATWNVLTDLLDSYPRGKQFTREFSYIVRDCYLAEHEDFVFSISKIVDRATVIVKIPSPAQFLKTHITFSVGDYRKDLEKNLPQVSEDNRTLTWSITGPYLGETYMLRWTRSPIAGSNTTKNRLILKPEKKSKKNKHKRPLPLIPNAPADIKTDPTSSGSQTQIE